MMIYWQRRSQAKFNAWFDWYTRSTAEPALTPAGKFVFMDGISSTVWWNKRPRAVMIGNNEVFITATTTAPTVTLLSMLPGFQPRMFSRIFGRIN